MPTKKTALKKTAPGKEKILKTITEQFVSSLSKLKEQLGDKKFEKRIKKATKLLAAGIEKGSSKKHTKKPEKKPVVAAKQKPVVAKKALKKAKAK